MLGNQGMLCARRRTRMELEKVRSLTNGKHQLSLRRVTVVFTPCQSILGFRSSGACSAVWCETMVRTRR